MIDFYIALQQAVLPEHIRAKESMAKHTSFQVGGPADYYITVASAKELKQGLQCCKEYQVDAVVLGNGSNVLVSDKGFHGVVFQLGKDFSKFVVEDTTVRVQAGMLLGQLGKVLLEQELTGFEFASGIPGTVGGAVYMNAGAYGGEIKNILKSCRVLTKDFQIEERTVEQLELGYRHSSLMKEQEYVLDATFQLQHGNYEQIKKQMDDLAAKRRQKQPLEYPSAGSTFKRPEGYYAGQLIQESGLRGYRVGGAMVSEKHCGFVINAGGATASEIYQLTEDVKRIVKEKFGVELEREIRLIGEF